MIHKLLNDLLYAFVAIRLGTHYGIPLTDSQAAVEYVSLFTNWHIQRYLNMRDARA